ncbi:MAG: cadherin domain-containing protein [Chloroflexi bacterium]|nr:cadherin domain-containing protein [Chloroflexota bacterium]
MTRVVLPDARLLAAVLVLLALLGLLIPLNAGAQATVPGAPTIDTVTARAGWLLVEWSAPSSNGGSTITAYDARYIETDATDKADSQWTEVDDAWATGGGELRYTLDGLTNDTEYDVQVRAVNAEGDGAWSAAVTGTPELSDATRATLAAVRGDDGAVAVTWNAPTTLVDADATYDLRYIETDATDKTDDQWTEVIDTGVDDRLLDGITGLTLDTEYDVQVRAVEFAVAGPWSDTDTGTPSDSGQNVTDAREITLATTSSGELDPMGDNYFWGKITDGAVSEGYIHSADWDVFKIVITDEQAPDPMNFRIFTEGSLDTTGRLFNNYFSRTSGNNSELPNPDAFLIESTLEAGTYFIRVIGQASAIGDYVLRIQTMPEPTDPVVDPVDPETLTLGSTVVGQIDPPDETDSWDLELTEQTDVIIRGLRGGNLKITGQLLNEHGSVLAQNNDGNLFPDAEDFVIRRLLDAGTYELQVSSHLGLTSGIYEIFVSDAGNPGSTIADAQALNLDFEDASGGNITSSADVDYFSITVEDPTYVLIWAAANTSGTDVNAELVDAGGTTIDANFNSDFAGQYKNKFSFAIAHRLDAGTHYVKVTGAGGSTGKYTILAVEDLAMSSLDQLCKVAPGGGISDPWYGCQWHLQDDALYGSGSTEDINVEGVWSGGNLGEGITVAVVDDGIHHQHEDLTDNVDTAKNHDFANQDGIYHPFETHGTSVAGLIAARDNAIGMRGVAPRATIYGYNYLQSSTFGDQVKAASLNADTTAISNNSWSSSIGRAGLAVVTSLWEEAIETAVTTGYGGKGVFFVWGAGNDGRIGGHSSRNERTNFYAVTAACAVGADGVRSSFSEPGSNLWVCAPSGGGGRNIATTINHNRYSSSFSGTSASAPIVSGVAALVRKANDALTWRDVKLILAASARKNDADNDGWEEGADKYGDTGKYNFNHEYGFGVVDAQAAVTLADGWTNLPGLRKSTAQSGEINISIPDADGVVPGTTATQKLTLDDHVDFIEYIQVVLDITHDSVGDLDVEVESPSGTISRLSPYFDRSKYSGEPPSSWWFGPVRLGSARHLGESSAGEWTLRVTDYISGKQGTIDYWSITAYGHGTKPAPPPIDEVQPSSGAFTVTWEAPADPGRSAITGYQVHYIRSDATDKSDGEWTSATTGASVRQHTASGLDGEAEYDVRVRAVSALGNGEWSETETVTTGALDAPAITSFFGVDETFVVKWTPPADSSLGTITSYDLRHKYTNFDGWYEYDSIWTSTAGGPLEHTLVPTVLLGRGRSHYVQVRAVVGTTEHPWSASRTVVGVPGPPFISSITADPDGNKITVQWASAVSVPPYPVTSYDLRYIETGEDETVDANWTLKTNVPSSREGYTLGGLTNWVSYDVQVRARNAGGPGSWSETATGTPSNTDVGLTLEWEDTSVSVNEDGGSVTLKAIATTDSDETLPSDFSFDATVTTDDDTATDPDDYAPLSGSTLTFDQSDFERVMTSSGDRYQATRDYTFTISDDAVDEDDETFTATLAFVDSSNPNFETRNAVATVTIGDDEQVGVTLGWNPATVSVNESSSTVRLTATATTASDKRPETGFTFDATIVSSPGTAAATDDYTHVSTTVTFNQADFGSVTVDGNRRYRASKSVTVPIVNDTDDERDETFTVTVDYVDPNPSHLQGGSAAATVTIQDNDRPTVSIAAVDTSAAEDDTLEFRLTRVGVPDDALTVNVRVSETRRMLASGQPTTATFSAGSSTATLDIALNDDTEDEDNSTVTVALRSGSGYVLGTDTSDTATALDNDHVPVTLGWAVDPVTVAEGAGQVVLKGVATTTKDKQPESGFSFVAEVTFADGTAGSGDYTGRTQRQTFSQSDFTDSGQRYEATKEFTVNIAGGDGSEDDETFTATLAYVGSDPLPAHLQGGSATVTVTITVIDDNVAPEFDDGTSTTRSVAENSPAGTAVGEPVEATDLNNASLTYEISSQQGGPYIVDTATGQIRVGDVATLDHERRTTQRVNLKVEDPDGLSDTIQVQIEVANVNEPPVISGNTAVEWRENRTGNVTRYTAADPERDSVEWTVSGTEAGFFSIDSNGYLTFNDPPDFEASRGNTYEITVVGTDTDSNSGELDVTVTVTNVNEPPTVEGRTSLALSENDEAFDETYSATDPEGSATTFTWSVSGTDGGDFTINRDTGVLTFRNTPDYERPADSNRDNEYLVQVRASDGSLTGALDVTVTVTPVNEPPTITGTETLSYAENNVRTVATYRATDPEGATIIWSLSGTDDDDFDISETGPLTFTEIPDFEAPDDANQDNEYLVTVEARDDAFNYARLDVTITVTNSTGAEEPTITTTSNPSPYRENGAGAVYTFRARDPQGRAVTWSVTGTDGDDFRISSGGALTFANPPDFENPADSNRDNIYEITVVVTDDQGLTDSVDVTITVTNHNEGVEPTISTRSPPSTYRENGTSTVYTFRASDPQRQDITWTLEGDDSGVFNISSAGALVFINRPDFEAPVDSDRQNDYQLTVIVTDPDGHADRLSFTITVTDVNEGPEVTGGGSAFTAQENRTWSGATFTASDPEGGSVTRWSLGGRDSGDFTITHDSVTNQGLITFRNTPDHERPDDSDRDNTYEVEIRPYDGRYYGSHHITITVQDVTEITGPSTLGRAENFTGALATYAATGVGDLTVDPAWRLTGTDGGDFTISEQGELTSRSTPDHERPADSNRDNVYNFAVQATDGRYYDSYDVTVTVTPVNEPPTITTTSTSATALRQPENRTTRLYTYRATDPEGGSTITWSVGGVDERVFAINERGEFSFDDSSPPDYEIPGDSGQDNVYDVTIEATDDGGNQASLPVTITVTAVNEGPEVTSGRSSYTVAENQNLTSASYTAFDPEGGAVTRWAVGGTDGGDFQIDESGVLTFRTLPDYERPADSNRDNVYQLQVRPYDGRYYGAFDVTVTVDDVNEPPTITTTSSSATTMTHPENRTTRLYAYRATDPEGATIVWSVAGVDARFFAINDRGELSFSESDPPDFEARAALAQEHVYHVTVQAGDGTHTASLPVAVTVTDVNEGPVVSGTASFTIPENGSLSGAAYSARDPEGEYVTRWSVGGRDGGDFFITQGGTLYFRSPPDYERPADSNRDNVYEVTIQPYDGRNTGSFAVTITVTNVNEPPEFRSGSSASFTQPENRATRLYTYYAADPEGGTVTWSVGGADGGHFAIDERGQFSFDPNNPPDFDAPGDLGGNNTYNVSIEATDPESNTGRLPVTVIVTEVNEGPVITLQGAAPGSVRENHPVTQALARYTASDPERPTVSITQWSTSGPDGGDFVMNALGELRFRLSPDYERPADANRDNVYEVTIRASDGRNTGTMEEAQVVTVTDVNEPPTITTTSRTAFTQPENRNTVLYTFRATDPEGGTISWTPAGTDGRLFTIDEQGGFFFTDPPDFESPGDAGRDNVYDVTIEARDPESNAASLEVMVTVTNHNEGVQPTISTRRPPTTYQENRTTTVYTFRASDPQRGVIAWSLTGPDAGDFSITESGALTFNNPPDFENPADANRDNTYELTVVATDAEGYTDRVSFAITVTNHNEGVEPTISTRRPPTTYQENRTTTVYTFSASDPQRQTITWSLDGADRSAFAITADTSGRGVLAFATPPDFESPADSDRDNAYELAVIATDTDGNRDRLDFTITITDVNEAPSISLVGTATTTVPENYADTRVLARYKASDPENPGLGIHRWSTTGRDAGDFVISALGELRFRASPDYERPADSNRDNVYEVAVRASDGRSYGMLAETLLLTVTNVNEAPVITTRSRTEFTLRENTTSTIYTYRATDQDADDRIRWSVEGTDGDDFAIHDGMLTFRLLPDLEVPADSNRDNVYEAVVVTTDNGGLRDTVDAVITITDQSEGPLIAGTTSFTVVENYDITQALGTYTATDAKDGRRVYPQWSLTGRDGGDFVIDRYSGVLSFRNTPDYDRPADSDRDNVYEVTIRGHDSRAYGYLNVVVTVTNINESAPVVTGSTARTVRENTTSTIYTYRATDSDLGDTIAWSTGGDDGTHFVITRNSSGQGLLAFAVPPDFENPADLNRDNVYNLDVVATDAAGLRGILAVTITVTALNEGPVVSGTAAFTVDENRDLSDNQAGSSATYTARDPEAIGGVTTTITWSTSGRDGGDFIIDRETGALAFRNLPNYERPADYNRDNVYELIIRAYDGRNYGTFDVTVTVLEVNEGPEITGSDTFTYRENGTAALYTYRATDPEDDSFTWQLGGPDAGDFAITTDGSGRGVLNFASPPNFDVPAGSGAHGNEYLVTVQARDANFNVGELPVTVTVTDLNEGAFVSGQQTIAVQENHDPASILATYSATDPEGQPITRWSLSGSDGGDFTISADGELTFRYTPDYDRPADSNRDNEYRITVRAYDGRTYGNLDVVITVSNINEHDPVISSGSRTSFSYREETTSVLYTYRATDGDKDDVITWSTSGTDGHLFEFNDRNGLVFREPPDYENPNDSGRDNVYDLTVVATDTGGRSGRLDVTITVTAVDEGPEISGTTNYTVLEGQELIGATFTATDPEDPTIVVSNWRTSGTDGGDFTISQDGTLSFRNTPDYDRPADSNRDNIYLVTVQVSDGRYYGSLEVTVTVTDQNESTPVVSGRETLSFRENTASTLYTYRVSDADLGATITWSVRGTDGGDFDINSDGQLTFRNPPDHERPADSNSDNVYEITVVASDGSNEGVLAVTITVTAVNEGPEISGRDAITVFENHTAILATYTGADPEDTSADITRWGTSGRDGGDFTITTDGDLSFRYPPNHERPADSNRDNVYELTVRASDGSVYGYYDVIVTVQPVDEAPEFRSGSREAFTYRENATSTLYTYRATDPEGADVAWSVSGADAGYFAISDTGVLTFIAPPNFENPARFDGTDHDNEYEVSVVATDQSGHAASLTVIVTVSDVNEGPEITGCTEAEFDTVQAVEFEDCGEITVPENHDSPLYTYTARDPEIPDLEITRWITSGRDGGDFTITDDGELSFRHPPDSERPADYDRDGIYEVTVRASDGRYYGAFDVIVTVEAVDEAPEFHSSSRDTFVYRENQTTSLHTYRATDPEGSDVAWGLSGQDGADFQISEDGVLEFLNAPDYERPADSNRDNIYQVTVEATDENRNTRQLEVTITVVNLTD